MARPKVFVPEQIMPSGLEMLRAQCDCIVPWEDSGESLEALDSPSMKEHLYESEAVVIRIFSVTAEDLEKATRLKVIGKHGVGVDSIDCEAATARGIPVAYTPLAIGNGVAEHVVALMFAMARNIVPADASVRDVVGMGRIGQRIVQKASLGLDMKVHAFDPILDRSSYDGPAVLEDSVEDVMRVADYLTLHVPLTPETHHLIDEARLQLMKPSCRLINTSRGAVVDEAALAQALHDGRIAGAALDVFDSEPLPVDHPLCHAPNTVLTPHIASSTTESLDLMSRQVAEGILAGLAGRRPEHVFNSEVYG